MVKYKEDSVEKIHKRTEKADKLLGDMIGEYMESNKEKNKEEMDKKYRPEEYARK